MDASDISSRQPVPENGMFRKIWSGVSLYPPKGFRYRLTYDTVQYERYKPANLKTLQTKFQRLPVKQRFRVFFYKIPLRPNKQFRRSEPEKAPSSVFATISTPRFTHRSHMHSYALTTLLKPPRPSPRRVPAQPAR